MLEIYELAKNPLIGEPFANHYPIHYPKSMFNGLDILVIMTGGVIIWKTSLADLNVGSQLISVHFM